MAVEDLIAAQKARDAAAAQHAAERENAIIAAQVASGDAQVPVPAPGYDYTGRPVAGPAPASAPVDQRTAALQALAERAGAGPTEDPLAPLRVAMPIRRATVTAGGPRLDSETLKPSGVPQEISDLAMANTGERLGLLGQQAAEANSLVSPAERAALARQGVDEREARIRELDAAAKETGDEAITLATNEEIGKLKHESLLFRKAEREASAEGAEVDREYQRATNEQARLEAERADAAIRAEQEYSRVQERTQRAAQNLDRVAAEVARVQAEPNKRSGIWSDGFEAGIGKQIGMLGLGLISGIDANTGNTAGVQWALGKMDALANREVDAQIKRREQAAGKLKDATSLYDRTVALVGSQEAAIPVVKAATLARIDSQMARAEKAVTDAMQKKSIGDVRAQIQLQINDLQRKAIDAQVKTSKDVADERTMQIKHERGGATPGATIQETARGFIKDGFSPEKAYEMAAEAHSTGAVTIPQQGANLKPEEIGRVALPGGGFAYAHKDSRKELEERAASIGAVEDVVGEIIALASRPDAKTDSKIREQIRQKGNEAGTRVGVAFGQGAQGIEEAKKFAALAAAGAADILAVGNRGQIQAAQAMVQRMKNEVYGRMYSDPRATKTLVGGGGDLSKLSTFRAAQ